MNQDLIKTLHATELTSVQNTRIKDLVRLRDSTHRKRAGLLLIEGYRELSRAVQAGVQPQAVYYCDELFLGENEPALLQAAKNAGAQIFSLSKAAFKKISYRDRPDGLIATAPKIGVTLNELPLSATPLLIVAESIEKPGNLGTILRCADAVGADGVIVCDGATDINNPNVVRASTGTLFTVPVAEATSEEAFAWLREKGIRILAATPHATEHHTEVDLRVPCAVAMGAEQYGLSEKWMKQADLQVRIPMAGVADSLNVAMATTVLLFEVARQRNFGGAR